MIHLNNISEINWNDLKIGILGGGVSGIAAAKLGKYIGANIFISDNAKSKETTQKLKEFEHESGQHSKNIMDSDMIIISPGIPDSLPIIKECKSINIPIFSEIEFASWFTKSAILALTGSNGKTTTVNLLHEMCISDGKNSLLGGNVGIPFSENVLLELQTKMSDVVHILELSSFQLEYIQTFSPLIAGLLNISEDHMDRYENFNTYSDAKMNITKNISDLGHIIYNGDDPVLDNAFRKHKYAKLFSTNNKATHFKLNTTKIFSGKAENPNILFNLNETKLKGLHNLQNILAASTIAYTFGISYNSIRDAIVNFHPIPHRLEWIGNLNGVDFFNDSKATNMAAANAAIESFDDRLILIMGGLDKGSSDFSKMIPRLVRHAKKVFTYGDSGSIINQQIKSAIRTTFIEKFESAIIEAAKESIAGDTILLSPACASFDQFNNYEERGNEFKNIFNKLEFDN